MHTPLFSSHKKHSHRQLPANQISDFTRAFTCMITFSFISQLFLLGLYLAHDEETCHIHSQRGPRESDKAVLSPGHELVAASAGAVKSKGWEKEKGDGK